MDFFNYTVEDSQGVSSTATVTINIDGVDDAPTTMNTIVTTDEDTTYTFKIDDFPFSDLDGDSLTQVRLTSQSGSAVVAFR